MSPYDQMMQARLTPVAPVAPTMPAMSSGAPEDYVTRARMLRQQAIAAAPQGIDPRIAAILSRREERLAGQEEEIAQQEASSPWDALARAGAAMASSQSPFFGQALSAGVSEGLNSLNQGRAEAVRRRMALGGARDDIEMQRIEQEGAGKRQALADLETDLKVGGDMASAAKAEAEARLAIAKATPDPELRAIEVMKARREIDRIDAQIAVDRARVVTERAQAFKYAREGGAAGAGGAGGGKGGTGFLSPAEVAEAGLDPRTVWQRGKNGLVVAAGKAKTGDIAEVGRLLTEAENIIPNATGSGFGAAYTRAMNFLGQSTSNAEADAKLKVIAGSLIANMPRMEGPQSNADALLYKQAAGELENPALPRPVRLAALETMKSLNGKYLNQDSAAVDAAFKNATPLPAPNGNFSVSAGGKTYRFSSAKEAESFKRAAGIR